MKNKKFKSDKDSNKKKHVGSGKKDDSSSNKKKSENPFLKNNPEQPKAPGGFSPLFIWGIVILAFVILMTMGKQEPSQEISYSNFKQFVAQGRVQEINFSDTSVTAQGKMTNEFNQTTTFRVNIFPDDPDLMKLLEVNGVHVSMEKTNIWLSNIVFTVLPPLFLVLFLYFFIYRGMKGFGKGAMSFGKSKAKLAGDQDRVTFEDVAGIEEAIGEVREIIDFLKNPQKFRDIGARLPKGVLLVGRPGTGKTLLAKAIAGEAGVPFFSLSGSDFVEMFVGVGASRVRDLFEQGKKNSPCIMFLDEIDAVGRHRGAGIGGGHDEREQTLNALLVELDGFEPNSGVIMIAATNRPDVLDPALLRPGRFDRQIVVNLPDLKSREAILAVHARKVQLEPDVDLARTAKATVYFSGADLANLINEGAILAGRKGKKTVGEKELDEARDKVRFGAERKSQVVSAEDKENTSWHEAGHALVAVHCEHQDPVHKVTIIPRGQAAGMTMMYPEEDRQGQSRKELEDDICVCFGGRIAEMIKFGVESTGAISDIKMATSTARRMVCELGMSELGVQAFGNREEHVFLGREVSRSIDYSEETAKKIDAVISKLLKQQYDRAEKILRDHFDELEKISLALLEYETLTGDEVKDILAGKPLVRDPEPPEVTVPVEEKVEEEGDNPTTPTDEGGE